MKVVKVVELTEDQVKELQNAYMFKNGMELMMNNKHSPMEMDYKMAAKAEHEYQTTWEQILKACGCAEYITSTKPYRWDCDFNTKTVTITL